MNEWIWMHAFLLALHRQLSRQDEEDAGVEIAVAAQHSAERP
jgi:hypothetical protein